MSYIIPSVAPRTTSWSLGPDAAYEGSDPTGAVWVTVCGRGRLRGVALFGGWRGTIGADLGHAVMEALADACAARHHAVGDTSPTMPRIVATASARPDAAIPLGTAGTSQRGHVTVIALPSGEVTAVTVVPGLLTSSDFDIMREIRDAFRAAYAAMPPRRPLPV